MSRRYPRVMGRKGMISSPHYFASLAGIGVLREGGNAVDAAVAASAVLTVVYPQMCGLGGDCFMLIHPSGEEKPKALNGSGRSPHKSTREFFLDRGYKKIPIVGVHAVTVPGIVDSWSEALERYGSMDLSALLRPAIRYAEEGFPASEKLSSHTWANVASLRSSPSAAKIFLKDGCAPLPGDLIVQRDLAWSLKQIASKGKDAFYKGAVGERIVNNISKCGGLLDDSDLRDHHSDWTDPICTDYRGYDVYAFPPNTQGLVTILELNIVEGFDLRRMGLLSVDTIHRLVESKKLAFVDREQISDPNFVQIPLERLLSKSYAEERRRLMQEDCAINQEEGGDEGDTVSLSVVDEDGNAVSLIASLHFAFGSRLIAEGTGVLLHNRGAYFSLSPDADNRLEPRKRTLHTLSPIMVHREGTPSIIFGTSGGDGQPQTHLQVLTAMIDFEFDIQSAIESPRWISGRTMLNESMDFLTVEDRIPQDVLEGLKARGHRIRLVNGWADMMGNANGISINSKLGLLTGGTDPRSDGLAIAL